MSESLHSRRTIVKGAAWSLPVIAAVAAVPAQAASPDCTNDRSVLAYAVVGTNLVVTNTSSSCPWTGPLYANYQVYEYPFNAYPFLINGIQAVRTLDRVQRVYYNQVALGTQTLAAGASLTFPITTITTGGVTEHVPNFTAGPYTMHQTFILTDASYRSDGTNTLAHPGDYGIDVYADIPFTKPNIPG